MTKSQLTVLHGDESFLIDNHVLSIQKQQPQATTHLFQDHFEWADFMQATQSTGLFATESIILIKNPWFFSKKITDNDSDRLIQIIEHCTDPGIHIIICEYGNLDQRKKLITQLKKIGQFYKYETFKDWEQDKFKAWIKQHLNSLGKTISPEALQVACDLLPTSLRAAASECTTLCTYIGERKTIETSDIKAIANDQQLSVYQFLERLKKRHFKDVYESMQHLQETGEDPIRLMGLLFATIRQYIQLLAAQQQGITPENLAKQIGKNPYFLKLLLNDIKKNYTLNIASNIYKECATLDYQIKSGQIKADFVFKRLPLIICS